MTRKTILLITALIFGMNPIYSQELDVLELVSNEKLIAKNVQEIKVYTDTDEGKIIRQKLYINRKGLLDSSFLYSHLDTNKIIDLQKNFYDADFRLTKSVSIVEMIVNTDYETEMVTSTSEFIYNQGQLEKVVTSGEHKSNKLSTYEYKNGKLFRKQHIDTYQKDTISVVDYLYSDQDQLIRTRDRRNGELVYFQLFEYDQRGNLIEKHTKNTQQDGRLVFEDYYFIYDTDDNRIKWIRYEGSDKSPMVYEYKYDDENLLIGHENVWTKEIITYQ